VAGGGRRGPVGRRPDDQRRAADRGGELLSPVPDGFVPYANQGPYLEHIGPVLVRDGDGELAFGLLTDERHANHRGAVQGGLLATFADFALGRAIEADADDGKDRATVSITIDYLKPAKPGDWVETRTRVERVGGTLSFADCSLTVDDREIVRARAVWIVAG
jgi:acyl-coenzyme A thioesterase 13